MWRSVCCGDVVVRRGVESCMTDVCCGAVVERVVW